jgi:hypothetical protein
MATKQGTGKHPHKSTAEPYPHHGGGGAKQSAPGAQGGSERQSASGSDVKGREYRDKQGQGHHHTRTSKEERGKR